MTELLLGNVYLLFAASLVLSLGRFLGAVALPILTKVAPGRGRSLVRRPRRVAQVLGVIGDDDGRSCWLSAVVSP